MSNSYNKGFYIQQMKESRTSASHVLPVLFEYYKPKSVIDIGCGTGSWLAEYVANGVNDIIGIDGDYVDRPMLQIPRDKFLPHDLSKASDIRLGRRFDLAMSLEVAEHIPHDLSQDFIGWITGLADVVMFSAAIPYQGGTDHVNENWIEYWALIFRKFSFYPLDIIRSRIWNNPNVCWWYRQNIIVYARESVMSTLFPAFDKKTIPPSLVHPEIFLSACVRGNENEGAFYARDLNYYRRLVKACKESRTEVKQDVVYNNLFNVLFDGKGKLRKKTGRQSRKNGIKSFLGKFWQRDE